MVFFLVFVVFFEKLCFESFFPVLFLGVTELFVQTFCFFVGSLFLLFFFLPANGAHGVYVQGCFVLSCVSCRSLVCFAGAGLMIVWLAGCCFASCSIVRQFGLYHE